MQKNFFSNCSYLRCRQTVARGSYKWLSYKKGFGCWWVVVGLGGYVMAGGGWCIYFGWWWVVVDGGGWWHSLV